MDRIGAERSKHVATAHLELTDAQNEALRKLAQRTGKTENQLLREAVDQFLGKPARDNRLALLHQARGMWKDRTDLPDFEQLRAELDRLG